LRAIGCSRAIELQLHAKHSAHMTRNENQTSSPGFLDSIIIILVSSALVIFLLWVTSRVIGIDAFEHLPGWLSESYHAIWTSIATGTAGIGLAIVKALTRPQDRRPNYLLLIGITTVMMVIFIFILPRAFKQRDDRSRAPDAKSEIDPKLGKGALLKKQNCIQTYEHSPEKTDVKDVEIHNLPSVLLDEFWGGEPNRLQLFTIRLQYPGRVVNATCSPTDSYVHVMNNDPNQRDRWIAKGMSRNPDWNDDIVTCLGMTNTTNTRYVRFVVQYKEPKTECSDVN
jgi:hypothetical protein